MSERGLRAALQGLASRASLPVELAGLPDERLPDGVEAAAYYLVAEALTNVAKYAQASVASVRVMRENGHVLVEIVDDGIGGADPSREAAYGGSPTASRHSTGGLTSKPAWRWNAHPGRDPLPGRGRAPTPRRRRGQPRGWWPGPDAMAAASCRKERRVAALSQMRDSRARPDVRQLPFVPSGRLRRHRRPQRGGKQESSGRPVGSTRSVGLHGTR